MMWQTIWLLLTGVVILLVISAVLAPLESLTWYAGWQTKADEPDPEAGGADQAPRAPIAPAPPADHYLVYLSGIGAISGASVPDEEAPFIQGLMERLPRTRLVADVFPYAMANRSLNGQRFFAGVWRWIERLRLTRSRLALMTYLVNLRNTFQVAVSADRRYGPVYNLGVAQVIRVELVEAGYPLGRGVPVTILGWSGGGQIAVGAAAFLRTLLGAPIYVISLGGLLADDPGSRGSSACGTCGAQRTLSPQSGSTPTPGGGRSSRTRSGTGRWPPARSLSSNWDRSRIMALATTLTRRRLFPMAGPIWRSRSTPSPRSLPRLAWSGQRGQAHRDSRPPHDPERAPCLPLPVAASFYSTGLTRRRSQRAPNPVAPTTHNVRRPALLGQQAAQG